MHAQPTNAAIINSIPAQLAVLDVHGVIIQVNDAWQAFARDNGTNDVVAQGVGMNYLEACRAANGLSGEEASAAHVGIDAVLKGEADIFDLEYPCHTASEQRWILMTATPYKGFPGHAVVTHVDTTERKLAELHNTSFDHILEESLNEIYIFDAHTLRFLRVNKGARDNLGYSMHELRTMTPVDIKPNYSAAQFRAQISSIDTEKLVFNTVHQRKDTSTYPVEVHLERTLLGVTPVFVAIIQDITIREQSEKALRAAHDELEARVETRTEELHEASAVALSATATKSRFLAAASHDLRQPLQAASLYLALLAQQLEEPGRLVISDKIGQSLDAMGELLNALLDVSRLDAGMQNVDKQDLPIRSLLERIVGGNVQQAREKGLELMLIGDDCIVRSDGPLLERVIENFVTNAIRYTEHGRIIIDCQTNDTHARIAVTDTGVGIPQKELENIFEEAYQLDNRVRDRTKGLGLGLAIVKHIARLLDHSIDVSSVPGKGSTFSVTVPLGQSLARPTEHQVSEQASAAPAGQVVLLVDDDPAILDSLTLLLDGIGFRVHSALSVDAALACIDEGVRPHVVVTDYRLPGGNGLELIQRIRSATTSEVPAVVVTGDTSNKDIERAALSNCRVLRKPVRAEGLLASIKGLTAHP